MKKICTILFMFYFYGLYVHSQALNYSNKLELLNEQILRIHPAEDSTWIREKDYINGKLNYPVANNFVHPFFMDNNWRSGKIWLNGTPVELSMVKYDIVSDYLVYLYYSGTTANPMYFNREFIKEFNIENLHFKFLGEGDKYGEKMLKRGYYEVVHDGITRFYIRREKMVSLNRSISQSYYTDWTYFFLNREGRYIKIKGHNSFLRALKDHRKEMRVYMRNNSFRFNKDNYSFIDEVLDYYDSL